MVVAFAPELLWFGRRRCNPGGAPPNPRDVDGSTAAAPNPPSSESEFWVHLEMRVCLEFSGLPVPRYRWYWCDGFDPEHYFLGDPSPSITGRAWICDSRSQWPWDFTLLLPRSFRSLDEVNWAALLPADNVTRWMSFDERRGYIEIEPAAAEPDPD